MAKKSWLWGGFTVGAIYGLFGANPTVLGANAAVFFKPVAWTNGILTNQLGQYVSLVPLVNIALWGLIGLAITAMLRK